MAEHGVSSSPSTAEEQSVLPPEAAERPSERPGPESASSSESSNPSLEKPIPQTIPNDKAHLGQTGRNNNDPRGSISSLRSRVSARSTIDNSGDHSEKAEKDAIKREEERGLIRRIPFFRPPLEDAERWHDEADTPPQWTPLFYGESRCRPPR